MTTIYMATGDALAVIRREEAGWVADLRLRDLPTQCLAADASNPKTVFCGTFGSGLWRSQDGGASWEQVDAGISHAEITSVAVSPLEANVAWAGTEPSALFVSQDGGESWEERPSLRELPSSPTWSFPPRPWTSHVRWVEPDPTEAKRLFVGIELGGVMRSLDGGLTWEDRKEGSQFDAHTLRTHPLAPGRLYEAAGGGYAESRDGGATWKSHDDGLSRRYVWGLAVDPADPETVLVSAAPGPREAHGEQTGEAAIYRRSGDEEWQEITDGLPSPKGTRAYVLAANPSEPGTFYAAARHGDLYRSSDAGLSWEQLNVTWPANYRAPDVRGLAIVEEG